MTKPVKHTDETSDHTVYDAAVILNVSRATIDRIIQKGELKYYRAGAGKRITREELDRYRGLNS